jgi:hypothetical protein
MSRVQPPGSACGSPFSSPFGKLNALSAGGHVFAVPGMNWSIVKNRFVNALANDVAVVASVQVAPSGGVARFASFCFRHVKGAPAWLTWVWCEAALARPFTPSQPP